MIVGILLAAGRGTRFGADKLLHPLPDGTPIALAAAAQLRPACDRLIVVLRPGSDRLSMRLTAMGCETVVCPAADAGMGHSLAAGIRATADASGWLVALADMPFIAPASHRAVADRLRAGASLTASLHNGRRGHPVGFGRQWFDQLTQLSGDEGARKILESRRDEIVLCPTNDAGVLRDIDRPEDLTGNPTARHAASRSQA